jgi:hypothetical protein
MKFFAKSIRFVAPVAAILLCAAAPDTVTDKDLIKYAEGAFDKSEMMFKHVELGVHHGAPVVADFPCADACPDATARVIHYKLDDGQSCSSVGGVERGLEVPTGLGKVVQQFCVPKALAARGLARTQ